MVQDPAVRGLKSRLVAKKGVEGGGLYFVPGWSEMAHWDAELVSASSSFMLHTTAIRASTTTTAKRTMIGNLARPLAGVSRALRAQSPRESLRELPGPSGPGVQKTVQNNLKTVSGVLKQSFLVWLPIRLVAERTPWWTSQVQRWVGC